MNQPASDWAREQLTVLDHGWEKLQEVIERLEPNGIEQPLTPAWTVKEMLAHLAFWEETSLPVIQTIFRGGPEIPVSGMAELTWNSRREPPGPMPTRTTLAKRAGLAREPPPKCSSASQTLAKS